MNKESKEITTHVVSESSENPTMSDNFTCEHCESIFDSSARCRHHTFDRHPPLIAFETHGGIVIIVQKIRLKLNYRTNKTIATINVEASNTGVFVCPFCSSILNGFSSFQNHVSRIHPDEPKPTKHPGKRNIEQFSFEEGCVGVLQNTDKIKKQKCAGLAMYHDLQPVKSLIKQQDNIFTSNNLTLPIFINNTTEKAINHFVAPNRNFEAQLVFNNDSSTDTTTITEQNYTNNNLKVLCCKIQCSRFPKILSLLSPFVELYKEIDDALNCDFFPKKYLFPVIPDLFVGSILQGKDFALLITTVEIYARDANIDEHLETDRSTFPSELECEQRRYKGFTTQVVRQSNGGGVITKLLLGTTQFNLLVTGSLVVFPHVLNTTSVGLTSNPFIAGEDLANCMLFFPKKNIDKFMVDTINPSNTCSKIPNVDGCSSINFTFTSPLAVSELPVAPF